MYFNKHKEGVSWDESPMIKDINYFGTFNSSGELIFSEYTEDVAFDKKGKKIHSISKSKHRFKSVLVWLLTRMEVCTSLITAIITVRTSSTRKVIL